MRRLTYSTICTLLVLATISAQETKVKGRILESYSNLPISDVSVQLEKSDWSDETDSNGLFELRGAHPPEGEQVVLLTKGGYIGQRIPITVQKGRTLDLGTVFLEIDLALAEAQIGIISLSDNELDQELGTSFNTSGLLQANRDAFLNAAAFDFSAAFFRPRGLDNAFGKILINGIEMNKPFNGRPQWSNWGGLNDAQRNREFTQGLKANEHTFGDVAGTTNIIMRASRYRKEGRLSFASANRTYFGRIMASYNSGLNQDGWAYSFLASRRFGEEGFIEGTLYDANSFLAMVEKKFNDNHSLNLTAFYTPNRRGRSTAITEEVEDLKGRTYNPNWGFQNGKIRSGRTRRIEEPVIMLNHYWDISEKTRLNTNIGYQFGRVGNTRIDPSGNRNPAGNFYQRLPSYFLRDPNPTAHDYQLAFLARQEFINDGQLDWESFYAANAATENGNSVYIVQEDVNEDSQITINGILSHRIDQHISLNANVSYRSLKSANFAEVRDLLGGSGYLDIDFFGDNPDQAQSDLQNPNRLVLQGERFRYNYQLTADLISGFAQGQFKYNKVDFFLAASASQTRYQRTGLFQNGYFPEGNRSLGAGERVDFANVGVKGGLTYKITGRHLLDLNAGYFTKAPTLRNTFANARQNNDIVQGLTDEEIRSVDLSYIYRSPIVQARVTGFYTGFADRTEIGFFFTQNALGNDENSAFVQEIVTGIDTGNMGIEMGIEAQVLPTLKLKAASSVGQYLYTDNARLYLSGDDFDDPNTPGTIEGNDLFRRGKREVALKDYHVAGGPEQVFQLGFEYRSPEFWWVGVTGNYFSNAYVDVSNLRRTSDFYTDVDGQPFNDYNEDVAAVLLRQEQLHDYYLLNVVGGKSWKVNNYFLGFFATINNVLNQEYRTVGFEDSRRASYRQQLEEQNRENGPLFGNRYFFGFGTTYYVNVYVRF